MSEQMPSVELVLSKQHCCEQHSLGRFVLHSWLVLVQRFFRRELGFAETAVVFNIRDLLSLAGEAA